MSQITAHQPEAIIYLGNFCSSKTAKILAEFNGIIHYTFGNHDGDPVRIIDAFAGHDATHHLLGEGVFQLGGCNIVINITRFTVTPLLRRVIMILCDMVMIMRPILVKRA